MGGAILFVVLLTAAWMAGFVIACFGAHVFLVILESSAVPEARDVDWKPKSFRSFIRDGVRWPDEGFVDYFWKGFYLAYIFTLWFGPAVAIGRAIGGTGPWVSLGIGLVIWLCFPIGILSSLISRSRWTPFSPRVLQAYARRPLRTLAFYLLSLPALAVFWFTFDLILIRTGSAAFITSLLLSPVAVLAGMFYARVLGRFAMVVGFAAPLVHDPSEEEEEEGGIIASEREYVREKRRRKRKGERIRDDSAKGMLATEEHDQHPVNAQPDTLKPIVTPEGEVTGYGVNFSNERPAENDDADTKPKRIVHKFDDEDDSPIGMEDAEPESTEDRRRTAEQLARVSEKEIALYSRRKISEPGNPYGSEVVTFLFDVKAQTAWIALSFGVGLLGVMQRGLDALRPQ